MSLKTALDGFVRKLTTKFSRLQTWATSVNSHTHPCIAVHVGMGTTTCTTTAGVIPALTLQRSLVWNNATDEEYNQAMSWINATMSSSNLTNSEENIKDFLLSNPSIISAILGPVVEEIYQQQTLSQDDIADHVFQLDIGEESKEGNQTVPAVPSTENIEILDVGSDGKEEIQMEYLP